LTPPGGSHGNGPVLIIDDQADARRLLARHIEGLGRTVLTADSGAKGLWMARTQRPAVILLDVMMPDVDGWSVLGELKADAQTADIPVVMCTIADEEERGYALGAADYITKPVDRMRLLETVSRFSGGSGHVLVVEDDPASSQLIERTLVRDGWEVTVASDGGEGLERLSERRPDLILLDLVMPEMNGFEFLERVRASNEWRRVPVIVVTAKTLSEKERRQLEGQVEGIVGKSADATIETLLQKIASNGPYL
jgi:CheY-like chemotaxis protein